MRFGRLNNLFEKRGGDLFILIFSLLLAFFMWSMLRMTQMYSAVLNYKVELNSNIEGRARSAISRNLLVLRGKSSGFFILQQKNIGASEKGYISISMDAKQLKPLLADPDVFYVKSNDIKGRVQEILGNDFQLEGITSDTLFFHFPKQSNKKVPVAGIQNISFKPQYMAFGRLSIRPDSVVIYGNTDITQSIDSVCTQVIKVHGAHEPVQGIVHLKPIKGVRFSNEDIYYSLDVVRYFENSVTVKPNVVNVPSQSKVLLIPQDVTIKYRAVFDNKKEVNMSDFQVIIDYQDINNSSMVQPRIIKMPEDIFSVRVEPKFIECIVN